MSKLKNTGANRRASRGRTARAKPGDWLIARFNMIEVALAMAIIAFGMISVLALFPVGLTASRNAVAENYSADAADQFISYIRGFAGASRDNYDELFVGGGSLLRDVVPAAVSANMDAWSKAFLEALRGVVPPTPVTEGLNVFECTAFNPVDPARNQVFFITQGADNAAGLDFSAALVAWKKSLGTRVQADGTWLNIIDDGFQHYAGLCVEISWPLEIAYSEREKRYYYIEIKRPE